MLRKSSLGKLKKRIVSLTSNLGILDDEFEELLAAGKLIKVWSWYNKLVMRVQTNIDQYMGSFLQDFGVGGGIPPDPQNFLQCGSSGVPPICIRDLGDETQDREEPRRIPPQDGPPYGGNATKAVHGGAVGISAYVRSNGGGGDRGGGDICIPPP